MGCNGETSHMIKPLIYPHSLVLRLGNHSSQKCPGLWMPKKWRRTETADKLNCLGHLSQESPLQLTLPTRWTGPLSSIFSPDSHGWDIALWLRQSSRSSAERGAWSLMSHFACNPLLKKFLALLMYLQTDLCDFVVIFSHTYLLNPGDCKVWMITQ